MSTNVAGILKTYARWQIDFLFGHMTFKMALPMYQFFLVVVFLFLLCVSVQLASGEENRKVSESTKNHSKHKKFKSNMLWVRKNSN